MSSEIARGESSANPFLDIEAVVDNEGLEEEEEEEEWMEEDEQGSDDAAEQNKQQIAASRESRITEEELEWMRGVARKYKEAARRSREDDDTEGGGRDEMVEPIWRVPVKEGQEAKVVELLTEREEFQVGQGRTTHVYSAFVAPLISSAVYVRALNKEHIILACQEISSAKAYAENIRLVPERERESLMRKPTGFVPEDWVRFARGKHAGDLALVADVDANKRTCKVFYVPRLELDGEVKRTRGGRKIKPQQALFQPKVVKSAGEGKRMQVVSEQDGTYKYRRQIYNRGLREERGVKFKRFVQTTATPTYEEFYNFQRTGILDIGLYGRTLSNIMALTFKEGAKVTIIAGQQKGLKGVVKERVDQNTLRVGFGADHSLTVDVPNQFVKVTDYEMGDTVEVIHGDGKGVKGLVVEVTEEGVIIHDGKATFSKFLQEVEHDCSSHWQAADPGKEERESRKLMPRERKHPLVNCECMIMQGAGQARDGVGAEFKGSLCTVKDFNPKTDTATVYIEKNKSTVKLHTRSLFPRPDAPRYWSHINFARASMGLPRYKVPPQKEKQVEREATPMPDQAEQEMLSSESPAWNPRSRTPAEGSDEHEIPNLLQPDLINKQIQVTIYGLTGEMCTGVIKALGHDKNHALVDARGMGDIEVPRHHMKVWRPVGKGNRVVVVKGEHLGKIGVVESRAKKYKGQWLVLQHPAKDQLLVDPADLISVDRF